MYAKKEWENLDEMDNLSETQTTKTDWRRNRKWIQIYNSLRDWISTQHLPLKESSESVSPVNYAKISNKN